MATALDPRRRPSLAQTLRAWRLRLRPPAPPETADPFATLREAPLRYRNSAGNPNDRAKLNRQKWQYRRAIARTARERKIAALQCIFSQPWY